MQIKEIHYNNQFEDQFLKLPKTIQKKMQKRNAFQRESIPSFS